MAQTIDEHAVTVRIETLERQLRRLKALAFVLIAVVGATLTMAALPSSDIVRARLFLVVDEHGKERAQLGLSSDGEALLSLLDERQTHRAGFGLYAGGEPYLRLAEKHGRTRLSLQAMDGDRGGRMTGVYLADDRARPRATLTVDGSGAPTMSFLDDDARSRFWVSSDAKGAAFLVLGDERARPRLSLRTDGDGRPALQLFDRNQRARMLLALDDPDTPLFRLNDRDGAAIFTAPSRVPRLAAAAPPLLPH